MYQVEWDICCQMSWSIVECLMQYGRNYTFETILLLTIVDLIELLILSPNEFICGWAVLVNNNLMQNLDGSTWKNVGQTDFLSLLGFKTANHELKYIQTKLWPYFRTNWILKEAKINVLKSGQWFLRNVDCFDKDQLCQGS